jgi:hypothetical protein
MKIVYLSHLEFLKKIQEFEKTSMYIRDVKVHNGKMELVFYTQTGAVAYRARPVTKLERVLR